MFTIFRHFKNLYKASIFQTSKPLKAMFCSLYKNINQGNPRFFEPPNYLSNLRYPRQFEKSAFHSIVTQYSQRLRYLYLNKFVTCKKKNFENYLTPAVPTMDCKGVTEQEDPAAKDQEITWHENEQNFSLCLTILMKILLFNNRMQTDFKNQLIIVQYRWIPYR